MPLEYGGFEASKLVSSKTLLLKHYYRRQGYFHKVRAIRANRLNVRFANFSPRKRDSQQKGVQFGNPETLRELSGLQHFSYAISQIVTLPPVVAPNRSSKSLIAARHAAFWHVISQIALVFFL